MDSGLMNSAGKGRPCLLCMIAMPLTTQFPWKLHTIPLPSFPLLAECHSFRPGGKREQREVVLERRSPPVFKTLIEDHGSSRQDPHGHFQED